MRAAGRRDRCRRRAAATVQDRRVLVAVQHPGEIAGATVENPLSTWPGWPGTYVRPAVVAVWRKDGCDVGV